MSKRNDEPQTRPGVILYFDVLCPALARLSDTQAGKLLRGIIEYALTGALPELDDLTGMAFDLLRPGIDRDAEKYEAKKLKNTYAAYCRWERERGGTPVDIKDWVMQTEADVCTCIDVHSDAMQTMPTTTTSPSPSTTTNPNRTIVGRMEEIGGVGEKETAVVPLSKADAFLQRHKDDANQGFVLLCAQRMRDHEQQQ